MEAKPSKFNEQIAKIVEAQDKFCGTGAVF